MREMKDSGVQWIGSIPSHWHVTKLLNTLRTSICDGPHETPNLVNEDGIPFISVDSLNDTEHVDLSIVKKFISLDDYLEYRKKTKIEKGDILFSKAATIGKTAIVDDEVFMVWSPLAVIKVNLERHHNKYIYYLLNCNELIKHIGIMGSYNTQINVGMRSLERAPIPVPTYAEQSRIAAYLDRRCAAIDALIANQQQQIDKLKQYKQAVITEAVTCGLDPNVRMKDSGVEWIGDVPEHWEIIPSKHLFANCDERRHHDDEQMAATQKYGVISQKEYMERENCRIVLADKGLENWKHVEPNDFVISLRSFQGGLEYCEKAGCVTWHYIVLRAKRRINYRYYRWLFKSPLYIQALQHTCNYIRDGQDLRYSNFVQVPLCIPSMEYQETISNYLDTKCAQIDALIALKQQKADKLARYKKSLIYEVVTGKWEI